jgi:hypothetical protein
MQVIATIQEAVHSMLDFIYLVLRSEVIDGPEPQQIPKGFRKDASLEAPDGDTSTMETASQPIKAQVQLTKSGLSAEGAVDVLAASLAQATVSDCSPGVEGPDLHWLIQTLQECCRATGCFLSMCGDEAETLRLIKVFPDLCSWILNIDGTEQPYAQLGSREERLRLLQPLLPALYTVQVLHTCTPEVLGTCEAALFQRQSILCIGICCISLAKSCASGDIMGLWAEVVASPINVACELCSSVLRSAQPEAVHAAETTYLAASDEGGALCGDDRGLSQAVARAVHELVCVLSPTLPAHCDTMDGTDDVASVIDVILGTAELMLIAAGPFMDEHAGEHGWVELVSAAAEALRIAMEYVLRIEEGDFTPLIGKLVETGKHSLTCWGSCREHLLLASVLEPTDVTNVIDRCTDLCVRLCACLEGEAEAAQVCAQTWLQPWLQEDPAKLHALTSTLEGAEQTLSLGHALQMLAMALQAKD